MIKKTLAALLVSLLVLTGCASYTATTKQTITLWAGGSDNVRQAFEAVATGFNAAQTKYELKIEFILSGSGAQSLSDKLIAAKLANQKDTNFDIIELGADEYAKYSQQGGTDIFTKLDTKKIANYSSIQSTVANGGDYIMPYRGTTVLLAYNSDKVKTVPMTAAELYQWIKDNPGRFAYNSPSSGGAGGSFVVTAIYNQISDAAALSSSDAKWKDQWSAGFQVLKDLNPYLYKSGGKTVYPNKNQGTLDLLANGEVDMIPAWADQAITSIVNKTLPASTKLAQISPAFTGSLATLAIPTIGSNAEGAYAVMNYIVSQEAQQKLLDTMAAIPVVKLTNTTSETSTLLKGLDIASFRTSSIGTLSTELYSRWDTDIAPLAN